MSRSGATGKKRLTSNGTKQKKTVEFTEMMGKLEMN